MKKIINNLLRKIFWLLLPLIKEDYMSKSIDDIIERKVIGGMKGLGGYNPKIKSKINGEPLSSTYVLEFPDQRTLTFRIRFDQNGLLYFFEDTTIIHLDMLNQILDNLLDRMGRFESEILLHFSLQK